MPARHADDGDRTPSASIALGAVPRTRPSLSRRQFQVRAAMLSDDGQSGFPAVSRLAFGFVSVVIEPGGARKARGGHTAPFGQSVDRAPDLRKRMDVQFIETQRTCNPWYKQYSVETQPWWWCGDTGRGDMWARIQQMIVAFPHDIVTRCAASDRSRDRAPRGARWDSVRAQAGCVRADKYPRFRHDPCGLSFAEPDRHDGGSDVETAEASRTRCSSGFGFVEWHGSHRARRGQSVHASSAHRRPRGDQSVWLQQ